MLDLLPSELLQTIFEYVGPPYWDEWNVGEDVEYLSSLSLVSKRLCSFAQPLLFAVLTLQASFNDKLLKDYATYPRCRELVSNLRSIRCDDYRKPTSKEDLVRAQDLVCTIVANAKHLTEMLNPTPQTHPMSLFSGSTLKRLHICNSSIEDLQELFLPELVELSLFSSSMTPRGLEQVQVPRLRHLAWCGCGELGEGIVTTLNTLESQLDSLGFLIECLPELKRRIPDFSLSRTLVDLWIGSDDPRHTELYYHYRTEIIHLRVVFDFTEFQDPNHWHEKEDLAELMGSIKAGTPSLHTLYIDSDRLPYLSQPTIEAREARAELIQVCHDYNVEVVSEGQPRNGAWYSDISPHFARRMSSRR